MENLVTKNMDDLWNPGEDSFASIQRIVQGEYIDDEWEDDVTDSVRKLYRYLLSDIEKPYGESLVDDKIAVIRLMLEDVLHYREAFLGDLYKIHLNSPNDRDK